MVPDAFGSLFEGHVDSQNHSGGDSAKAFGVSAAKLTLGSGIVLPSPRTSSGPRLANHAGPIVSLKVFGAWRHAIPK